MKKTLAIFSALLFIFLCGCNNPPKEEISTTEFTEETEAPVEISSVASLEIEEYNPARVFIAYFSHNDPVKGVAEYIYEKNDGVLHKIETERVYPDDEVELMKIAASENRPVLKNSPVGLSDYDIVILLFPSWCNTMPKALWTFIEDYDLKNKAIIPVCYGSQNDLNNAMRDIRILKPETMIVNGFAFEGDFAAVSEQFDSWLNTSLFG